MKRYFKALVHLLSVHMALLVMTLFRLVGIHRPAWHDCRCRRRVG